MDYTILVLDDQPENIKYISLLLKEMGLGKKVYSAPNGEVALDILDKVMPDIIIADWEMPVMNGLDFLKIVKSNHQTKDIPFIMITGIRIDPESMKECFDQGVHDYIRKPFEKLEFISRVSATLKLQDAYLKIKASNNKIVNQALQISNQHEQLEKLNHTKDRMISMMSHDLRAPLATLENILQIFETDSVSISEDELKYFFKLIKEELGKNQVLMVNMLDWAKSQMIDQQHKKLSSIHLREITDEVLELHQSQIQLKKLNIINSIAPNVTIYSDKNVISFLIRNLISNAIKFSKKEGSIMIYHESLETSLRVSVMDSGVGMDRNTKYQLFKNKQISSQKGTLGERGTGIALMLCRDMVVALGGTIDVESELGNGTTFSFNIPLNNKQEDAIC